MEYRTLRLEIADGLATVTLERKDNPANALNARMAEELFDVSVRCGATDVRAVIVTAVGKMFCGGGDLAEMDAAEDKHAHLTRMATLLHAGLTGFARIDAPVVMAVNGTAGGGGFSLALSADYVIASDKAKFVSAYTASGLTPDGSSTYHLAKHVGLMRAKELLLTNRVLTAAEALDWGIVNKVVAPEAVMDEARAMAERFAAGPTRAFGGVKRLLDTAYSDGMETQLDRETRSIAGMMRTHDGPAGIAAFLAKQKPVFKGN
ncbi:enoyl-CoA hydratase/isomerase family protein [Oceanibacterium hippocampi]|uniref:4-chlorobenzoyl coenzyme A dehalogenase-2 n=1 Tax=Oceanibacterium hippocampi TaxID=745714 RepID=A0A1Y5TVQ2_9PROT|nr:enoyl-CoA hydratase-related protein [Oceanibacterium hippocampi]SLN74429.1 4-chlorobenzoyl coenzyme A dehalogenase-2 [Oceanibacterium hippocampi]